jgi:hypothetical protein
VVGERDDGVEAGNPMAVRGDGRHGRKLTKEEAEEEPENEGDAGERWSG